MEKNIEGEFVGDEAFVEKLAERMSALVESKEIHLVASQTKKNTKELIMEPERRNFQVSEIRIQRASEEDPPVIVGYAAVFDSLSEDLGGFREKIAPGAFSKSIKRGDDVRALYNHDPNYVLGRSLSNTLKLQEDTKGLRIEIDPPDTRYSKDLIVSLERGDISQMSFGFFTKSDTWEEKEDEDTIRTLNEVDLVDVSPVTFPAYSETVVAMRSFFDWKQQHKAELDMQPQPDPAVSQDSDGKDAGQQRQVSSLIKYKLAIKQKLIQIAR